MTDLPLPVKPRKPQVRPKVRAAIGDIVGKGLSISEAAKANGLSYEGLRVALQRPHVRSYQGSVAQAWRESETFVAWNTVSKLQRGAASEDVQLKAARTFIQSAGQLDPESSRPPAVPVAIQIITAPQYAGAIQPSDKGVIESPAWSGFPASSLPGPVDANAGA